MIPNKGLNIKINHIQERALRKVYHNYNSSLEDLEEKSVTILQRNLQQLEKNIFKL